MCLLVVSPGIKLEEEEGEEEEENREPIKFTFPKIYE
jgi:hypothetical protein